MDQQFRAALGALFGPDLSQQQAANAWLNEFAKTSEAWSSALALLEPSSGATVEQAFFAANLLASKTRSEWGRLSPQQRSDLAEAYLARLRDMLLLSGPSGAAAVASVPQVLLDRLVLLAASAAALGGTAAAERHLAMAQELATAAWGALAAADGEPSRAGGEALLRCSLLMLQQLAEEADGLDSGRRRALLVGPADGGGGGGLAARRGAVVAMAREVLVASAGCQAAAAAAAGSPTPSTSAATAPRPGGASFPLQLAAVRCLAAWARLAEDSGSAGGGMAPGELEVLSPGLAPALLGLLALPPPGAPTSSPLSVAANVRQQQLPAVALYQAIADFLVDLLGPGGRTSTAASGGEAADAAATAAVVGVLVPLGRQLATAAAAEAAAEAAAGGGAGAGAALSALLSAVRVAVAVSERNTAGLATGPGEGSVELARMVLAAMAASPGRRAVTETAADYFLAINTVPTQQRHPALGAPLYTALVPYVLHAVSYPAGFTDWDSEVEEDEEAFHRFREQQAADLMESMYGQCHTALVAHLVAEATTAAAADGSGGGAAAAAAAAAAGLLPASSPAPASSIFPAGDWRGVEAALFCLRAIHMPVKTAALGGRAGELDNPAAAAQAAELQGLLSRIFADICSPSGRVAGLLSVPWVCLAASRLIGEYAAWLGKAPDAPLQAALALLLRALAVPPAAGAAAQAFRSCCVRGADRLAAHPPTLGALAAAAMAAVAPAPPAGGGGAAAGAAVSVPLGLEERCAVVEGLTRLVAQLPVDAASEAGCALMAPCVARVQSIAAAAAAAGGPLSRATLAALAAELGLMTAVVRFLEFPALAAGGLGGRHPAAPTPHSLGAVAATAGGDGAGGSGPQQQGQGQGHEHPAIRVLQVAWPVLSAVAGEPQCQGDPGVVEALAELYKRSLLSTKLAGRPLLPPLITSLLAVLRVRPHAAVLDCLATQVELFGEVAHSEEARALQVAALQGAVQIMTGLMEHLRSQAQQPPSSSQQHQQQQQSQPPPQHQQRADHTSSASPSSTPFPSASSPGELAAGFLTLADRYLLFARDLLLAGQGAGALPAMVEWACGVLVIMREREPAAAALSFLNHLLGAAARVTAEARAGASGGAASAAAAAAADGDLAARLDSLLAGCGPVLVHSLLTAGADTCPSQLMRPLAGCLGAMLSLADAGAGAVAAGQASESAVRRGLPGWLRGAWSQPPLAGLAQSGRLGEGAALAARLTDLLLKGHYPDPTGMAAPAPGASPAAALSRSRLDSLVKDFFAVARGEATDDVMLAYDM